MMPDTEVKDVGPQSGEDLPVLAEDLEALVAEWCYTNLMTPAKQYRTNVANDGDWPTYRELAFGDQWTGQQRPEDFTPFTGNLIMPTIDTVKGIALQTPAVVEFVPMEPDDEMFCMELTAVIADYLWGARKARFKLGLAFLEGATIGTCWSHTFWNPQLLGGEGECDFTILPAEEVWVDPSCTGINDWQYIIHAPRRPVKEVQYDDYRYNERRKEVQTDSAETEGHKSETAEQQIPLVTVYEYWVKGTWLKALVAECPGLEKYVDDTGWKYGIVLTIASGKVLNVKPHPFASDRFPFQRFVYYTPSGNQRLYGDGEVKYMADIQYSFNARMTQMLNQAALISNNQWVISTMIVMDEEELTNEPGKRIHVDGPPDALKRIEPTGISGSLFSITNLLLELQQIIPGMYDVNRGQTPGSLRAGVAIQALQRGGEGRTFQKTANFDEFVADIGLGLADVMAAMYTDERTFRIVGAAAEQITSAQEPELPEEPGMTEYDEDGNEVAAVTGQVRSTEVKMSSAKFKKGEKRIDLDARAQVGMMLKSTEEQIRRDMELLEAGVVDAQYVIENNQLRGKERLLARLFQTMAQNQQAGPGMPPVEESPTGNDAAIPDQDAEQMSMVIEQTLAQIAQAEQQGVVPAGFTQQVQQAVMAEIQQGGTGEIALQEAVDVIQEMMMQGQGQLPSPTEQAAMTEPGMAAQLGAQPPAM